MNILIVSDVLGEETNGTTIAAMNLIRHLKSKGHNVKILCADANRKGEEGFYVVPNLSLGIFNPIVRKNNVTLAKPDNDVILSALENTEHIHFILPFALGRRTLKLIKENNLKISTTAGFHAQAENLTAHVRMQNFRPANFLVYTNFYNKFYKYIDGIHYPTQFIRDNFEKGVNKHTNGYVISNGVNNHITKSNVEKPNEFKDKIVILSTGRYSLEKNQETLIRAVKYSKYKDKIQLILAGQGPFDKKFRKMCGGNFINPPILKLFTREEMAYVLNFADIYVHPAIIELEGIACLEAICAGKLVIVSDSRKSATKNFAVDPKCIFKNKNPRNLAQTIDYFIEHQEFKKQCEAMYLNSSNLYNQQLCMEKTEQMILDVHKKFLENNNLD